MDLIQEYINNIHEMEMTLDDYGDKKKVKRSNMLADRNRKIAAKINNGQEELKSDFIKLLDSNEVDIRLWAAHHIIEIMSYERPIIERALKEIEYVSEHHKDSTQRLGNKMWLKQFYDKHPEYMDT